MKSFIEKIVKRFMRSRGYSEYFSLILVKEIIKDLSCKDTTIKQKLWAYKRGFISDKIKNYNLTEENYKYFLSDFDYYKLYPINSTEWSRYIDDKLTTKYVLSAFNEFLPKYFFNIINKDLIIPLNDYTNKKKVCIEDVLDLLKEEGVLALKLCSGSHGVGFYKISYANNKFFIDDKEINYTNLAEFLNTLNGYLVTEYISSHNQFKRIYSESTNTVRVMVINEDGVSPKIVNSFIRFGTSLTGSVDNAAQGGITAIVDINTGKYFNAKVKEGNRIVDCPKHPDTKVNIEGIIPNWQLVKDKLIEISYYLPGLKYMGFDIAITEDSFKIIEINSHQDIKLYQYYYPLLKKNEVSNFFNNLLEINNKIKSN